MKAGGAGWFSAAAAAVLAVTCGDDAISRHSSVRFQTSLPGDETLNMLSADENAMLCQDVTAAANAFTHDPTMIEQACRSRGAIAAGKVLDQTGSTDDEARAACRQTYEACKGEPPMDAPASRCSSPDPACVATVDDFAACMNAELDFFAFILRLTPDCGHLDLHPPQNSDPGAKPDDGSGDKIIKEIFAPCAAYNAKCPNS